MLEIVVEVVRLVVQVMYQLALHQTEHVDYQIINHSQVLQHHDYVQLEQHLQYEALDHGVGLVLEIVVELVVQLVMQVM